MSGAPLRVLFIERDADAAASVAKSLGQTAHLGFELIHADGLAGGLEHLGRGGIDAVLLAVRNAQGQELDGLRQLRAKAPEVPVLVLADAIDPHGLEPVRQGAQDCLEKGQLSPHSLAHAVHCAVERAGRRAALQQRLLDLKASESRLGTVVERAADGILVVDGAGIIRFLNPACAALLGRSSDELLNSPFEFPLVAEGAMELELPSPQATRTVEMSVREIVWAGQPAHLATLRDITERKLAEQALLDSRPRDDRHDEQAGHRIGELEASLHEAQKSLQAMEHARDSKEQEFIQALQRTTELEQALRRLEEEHKDRDVDAARRIAELEQGLATERQKAEGSARQRTELEQGLQQARHELAEQSTTRAAAEEAMQQTQGALERLAGASWRVEDGLRLFEEAFANAAEGLMITDADEVIRSVNAAFSAITGYGVAEVLGKTPHLLRSGRHDQEFFRAVQAGLSEHGRWQGEIWNRRSDGEIYPQWQSICAIHDAQGRVVYYVTVFHDISERVRREREVEQRLHRDAVTGLANRSLLLEFLRSTLGGTDGSGSEPAVLVIHLGVGEAVPESVLDEPLLVAAAERLRGCAKPYDLVARSDDAQLSIAVADLRSEEPAQLARKVLAALSAPYPRGRHAVCLVPSVGVSTAVDREVTAERLFEEALNAMRGAREHGGNTFQLYDPAPTGPGEASHG